MRLTRRNFMRTAALAGASAAIPGAFAQEGDSIWDMMARNRVLQNVDQGGNTAAAEALIATNEPILSFDTAYNLQLAISQYEPFVAAGGWEEIPQQAYGLILAIPSRPSWRSSAASSPRATWPRSSSPTISSTRKPTAPSAPSRPATVSSSTARSTKPPGTPWPSPATRLQQLYLNYTRVQNMATKLSDRYVVVNIPAATIEAVAGGMVEQRHTAVVGRVDRATPILASKIHQINFNPYWHVPKSLVERDLTKYMKENPNYLTEQNIHIYDGSGAEISPATIDWNNLGNAINYMYRQEPGAANSMGHCKINFFNPYDVYLHDTPSKALFDENARFHSSGCVRVEGVNELVSWLLRDNGDWDQGRVNTTFDSLERLDVSLKSQVPIHTTYITAWANKQGTVSFRDDVYKFDEQGKVSFT